MGGAGLQRHGADGGRGAASGTEARRAPSLDVHEAKKVLQRGDPEVFPPRPSPSLAVPYLLSLFPPLGAGPVPLSFWLHACLYRIDRGVLDARRSPMQAQRGHESEAEDVERQGGWDRGVRQRKEGRGRKPRKAVRETKKDDGASLKKEDRARLTAYDAAARSFPWDICASTCVNA